MNSKGQNRRYPGGKEANDAVREVFEHPNILDSIDKEVFIKSIREAMAGTENADSDIGEHLQHLLIELRSPFKDPREIRRGSFIDNNLTLLYQLIDENPTSFRKGTIVTATVSKLPQRDNHSMVICRLENGLTGTIERNNVSNDPSERIEDLLSEG